MGYNWFKLDCSQLPLASLSGGALKCFLALSALMQEDQSLCLSYGARCRSLNISKRTAYRAVKELVDADLIAQTNAPNAPLACVIKCAASVGRSKSPENTPLGYRKQWSVP